MMELIKAFIVGGIFCIIGQILIDKTKLTPARILVGYVVMGVILVIALIVLVSILVVVLLVIHNKTSIRYYAAIREGSIPSVLALILCLENQAYDQACYNCGSNSPSSCA